MPTTNLLFLDAKQESNKKAYLLTKNIDEFKQKVKRKGQQGRKSNRTRQENKRGDSKLESNDSPDIPDREETSDNPSLPWGEQASEEMIQKNYYL